MKIRAALDSGRMSSGACLAGASQDQVGPMRHRCKDVLHRKIRAGVWGTSVRSAQGLAVVGREAAKSHNLNGRVSRR